MSTGISIHDVKNISIRKKFYSHKPANFHTKTLYIETTDGGNYEITLFSGEFINIEELDQVVNYNAIGKAIG